MQIAVFSLFDEVNAQVFHNVQASQNINHTLSTFDKWGNSVSFFDFDNDGWDDLTFATENDSLMVYKNIQGVFHKIPSPFFLPGRTKSVVWVDYDNDGDYDLAVTTYDGVYRLYKNDGDFNFTDVTFLSGLNPLPGRTYGVSFGDFNKDGFLDAYVCMYEIGHLASNTSKLNQLYANNGDGTFTNITLSASVGDSIQTSFQAAWIDFDNDGWQDLFVINDRSLFKNSLYRNNGNGTFTDVAGIAGVTMSTEDPMSTTIGDFNNDGFLDIFVTNTGTSTTKQRLFMNNGNGTFTDVAASQGVDLTVWGWGSIWLDYDNDGWQDLFVAEGNPVASLAGPNFFLRNNQGSFADSSHLLIGSLASQSTAAAKGDINNDGFYDFVVQNEAPNFPFLWQNSGNSNNHIKITLQGTVSNRMAIGSYIHVFVNGSQFIDYIVCGENYVSQNSQHRIIGIGGSSTIDAVHVTYLSGHTDYYYDLPANEHYYFSEGETLSTEIFPSAFSFCTEDSLSLFIPGNHQSVEWNNGAIGSFQFITEPGWYVADIVSEFGIAYKSDSIFIGVDVTPAFLTSVTPISCFGIWDGLIEVSSLDADSILWDNGSSDWEVGGLTSGVYSFSLFFGQGCVFNESIVLLEPSEIVAFYQVIDEQDGGDGSIDVLVFGGIEPFQFTLNGSVFLPPATGLSGGLYEVGATDANGCFHADLVAVGFLNTSEIEGVFAPNIFPNPSFDGRILLRDLPNGRMYHLRILDSMGKLMYHSDFSTHSNEVEFSLFLDSGVYHVTIQIEETGALYPMKLVVQR